MSKIFVNTSCVGRIAPATGETLAVFERRWQVVTNEGELQKVDEGIDTLIQWSSSIRHRRLDAYNEALDVLEGASYATTLELRKVLALDPGRRTQLPFEAGVLLAKATEQYVGYFSSEARRAVIRGGMLAGKCTQRLLRLDELTENEQEYLGWAALTLVKHLIYK